MGGSHSNTMAHTGSMGRNVEYLEASLQGKRPTQEDTHFSRYSSPKYPHLVVVAIFDGHNGVRCANFLRDNFERMLDKHLSKDGYLSQKRSERVFCDLDRKFCDKDIDSGSTAVVALFHRVHGDLISVNVGDSRCVLSRHREAMRLSVDHKPTDREEKARILRAGHNVWQNRLDGALMVSRAIGDKYLKYASVSSNTWVRPPRTRDLALTPMPSYRRILLDNRDEFVLMACDGLFEAFTDQEAVAWVHERLQSLYRRRLRRIKRQKSQSGSAHATTTTRTTDDDDNGDAAAAAAAAAIVTGVGTATTATGDVDDGAERKQNRHSASAAADDDGNNSDDSSSSSSDEDSEEDDSVDVDLDPDTILQLATEAHAAGNNLALQLAGAAIAKGSCDNVSVTLIFLGNTPDLPLDPRPSSRFGAFC